jgi:uncharacterized protein
MSLGGGLALMTAAADPRIAATVALVPMADGLEAWLQPAPPSVTLRMIARAMRGTLTRNPVILPVAGPRGSFSLLAAPEALPGFERLASGNGWRNELNIAGSLLAFARFRPVQKAAQIQGPVLVQLGEHDQMAPPRAIEKLTTRAPRAELVRSPIDHFECFWPDHIDQVADDQLDFLRRHLLTPDQAATDQAPAEL